MKLDEATQNFELELHRRLGRPLVLNVAGNRESVAPGIQKRVEDVIAAAVLGFFV